MLKVSLKTEYALRALMELAAHGPDEHVPAREIGARAGIPVRFLEHQLAALHKAGIVDSQRGTNGGAALARPASAITVAEVIEIFEGPLAVMHCLEEHDDECAHSQKCGLQELWMRVDDAVRVVFERTTIADLNTRHRELQPLLWPVIASRATHTE
jgi:Rrf2 family protein